MVYPRGMESAKLQASRIVLWNGHLVPMGREATPTSMPCSSFELCTYVPSLKHSLYMSSVDSVPEEFI